MITPGSYNLRQSEFSMKSCFLLVYNGLILEKPQKGCDFISVEPLTQAVNPAGDKEPTRNLR